MNSYDLAYKHQQAVGGSHMETTHSGLSTPFLDIQDIRVDFHGRPAVDGISLQVDRGEVIAIVGPSGSGKSTFLRCINHLQVPTSGSVAVGGIKVRDGNGKHPSQKELA